MSTTTNPSPEEEAFPEVRFNGCLGGLHLTAEEIVFEDASVGVELRWHMESLTEEMIHPMTSTMGLTFDMHGLKEKVSFQMTSFPEIARFRHCLARRIGAQRCKVDFSRPPSMEKLPNDLSDEASGSQHSVKSFFDEESHFSALSKKKEPDEESLALASVQEEHNDDVTDTPNPVPQTSYQPEGPATRSARSRRTSAIAPKRIARHTRSFNKKATEPVTNMVTPVFQSTLSGLTVETDAEQTDTTEKADTEQVGDEAEEVQQTKNHIFEDSAATLPAANLKLQKQDKEGTRTPPQNNYTKANTTNHSSNTSTSTPGAVAVSGPAPPSRKERSPTRSSVTTTNTSNTTSTPGATAVKVPVPKRKSQLHGTSFHLPESAQPDTTDKRTSDVGAHSVASAPPTGKVRSQADSCATVGAISVASEPDTGKRVTSTNATAHRQSNPGTNEPAALASDGREPTGTTTTEEETARVLRQAKLAKKLQENTKSHRRDKRNSTPNKEQEQAAAEQSTNNRTNGKTSNPSSELPPRGDTAASELAREASAESDCSTAEIQSGGSSKSLEDPAETTSTRSNNGVSSSSFNHNNNGTALGHLVEATLVEEGSSRVLDRSSAVVASPVDVVNEDNKRRKMHCYLGTACCLAIIIMVTAISVALNVGGGSSTNDADAPVVWTDEDRFVLLQEQMQPYWGPENMNGNDESSPQNQALTWMAVDDRRSQKLLEEGKHDELKQRFLLAVFYYSMTNKEKPLLHCKPPETGEAASCLHHVLETYSTEGIYYDQEMKEPAFRWLSYAHECGWAGITCTDGTHVDRLELAGYDLNAELPVQLGYLSTLKVLDLQVNKIRGSLPAEWGTIAGESPESSALESIRLDRNQLTGIIPQEWCELNLKDLVLSRNQLTGELPDCSFGTVENFSVLFNDLSGEIPAVFGTLSNLQRLHLAGNNFNGESPFCSSSTMHLLEASADCADPSSDNYVACPCCTTCCSGDDDTEACNSHFAEFYNS